MLIQILIWLQVGVMYETLGTNGLQLKKIANTAVESVVFVRIKQELFRLQNWQTFLVYTKGQTSMVLQTNLPQGVILKWVQSVFTNSSEQAVTSLWCQHLSCSKSKSTAKHSGCWHWFKQRLRSPTEPIRFAPREWRSGITWKVPTTDDGGSSVMGSKEINVMIIDMYQDYKHGSNFFPSCPLG